MKKTIWISSLFSCTIFSPFFINSSIDEISYISQNDYLSAANEIPSIQMEHANFKLPDSYSTSDINKFNNFLKTKYSNIFETYKNSPNDFIEYIARSKIANINLSAYCEFNELNTYTIINSSSGKDDFLNNISTRKLWIKNVYKHLLYINLFKTPLNIHLFVLEDFLNNSYDSKGIIKLAGTARSEEELYELAKFISSAYYYYLNPYSEQSKHTTAISTLSEISSHNYITSILFDGNSLLYYPYQCIALLGFVSLNKIKTL